MKLRQTLYEAFNIRDGEGATVAQLGVYSFLVGIFQAYYISLTNASFLAEFGVDYLPRGYLITGVVGYLVGFWLSRLQSRMAFTSLLSVALVFPLCLVCLFRLCAWLAPGPWLTFLMFVCIGPFISLVYFVFRALIGRLFNLRQSKRLFGLISSGDVLSAIIGFFSVPIVIVLLGDVIELLLFAGGALGLGWLVVLRINREYAEVLSADPVSDEDADTGGFTELFRDRYLLLIVVLATTVVLGFYYVDYVFLAQVRERFSDLEFLTRFISVLYGIIRVVELFVKTLLSGRLLNNYGLRFGLLALPALLCLTIIPAAILSLGLVESGQVVFLLVVLSKLIERVSVKAFHDPSFNVLYQPLPGAQRLGVQTRVEGLVQPLAIGLAGGTLWLFSLYGSFGLVMVVLALIVIGWAAVTLALHHQYKVSLLENLSQRVGTTSHAQRPDASHIVREARDGAEGNFRDWLDQMLREIQGRRELDSQLQQTSDPDQSPPPPLPTSVQHVAPRQRIDETVRRAAWSMAGIRDLENADDCGEVKLSLGRAIDAERANVFTLLGELYEAEQIQLVRDSFTSGDPEGRVYAMEQLDVLVETDLKSLLFPLLEDLQLSHRLRDLDTSFPQQKLTAVGRLCDVINSERHLANRWLRACALRALPNVSNDAILDEQIAQLFNHDPLLRETAADGIRQLSPDRLENCLKHLPEAFNNTMTSVREYPLYERMLMLHQSPLLSGLPETTLATLATNTRFQLVAAGDTVIPKGTALDAAHLLVRGKVDREDTGSVRQGPLFLDAWLWTPEAQSSTRASAREECAMFCIERATAVDIFDTWPEVAGRVVGAESLLAEQGHD